MTAVRHLTVKGELKKSLRSVCFRSSVPRFPLSENSGIWEGGEKKQAEGTRRAGEEKKDWSSVRKTRICSRRGEWCDIPRISRSNAGTCSRYSWIALKTRRTFHDLAGDALLWHPRGPVCCKQVGKVGGEETERLRRQMGAFADPSVRSFEFIVRGFVRPVKAVKRDVSCGRWIKKNVTLSSRAASR